MTAATTRINAEMASSAAPESAGCPVVLAEETAAEVPVTTEDAAEVAEAAEVPEAEAADVPDAEVAPDPAPVVGGVGTDPICAPLKVKRPKSPLDP